MKHSIMQNKLIKNSFIKSRYIFSLTTIIIFVFVWVLLSNNANNSYAFPSLSVIGDSFKKLLVEYNIVVLKTILKIVISVFVGVIISLGIVALYILKKDLIGFFEPILEFLHVVPIIGISLYLFLIFDDLSTPPYVITVMVVVPIIVKALVTAIDNIDKTVLDALKLEQVTFSQKLFNVYIPLIMPYFLMALLQSFSLGVKAMIMGEYICYVNGSLGALMYNSKLEDNGLLIAILLVLFLISILCEVVVKAIQRKLVNY